LSQATRDYFDEASVWSVDGTDFLGRFKSGSIKYESAMKENQAVNDVGAYPWPHRKKADLDWSEAVEAASLLMPGEVVSVSFSTANGDTVTGTLVVGTRGDDFADDSGAHTRPFSGTFRTVTVNSVLFY